MKDDTTDSRSREAQAVRTAFDSERFRSQGHRLIDQLTDYLAKATSDTNAAMPVLPWAEPEAMAAAWPADFPEEPRGDLNELLGRFIAQSTHIHHHRFVGHQMSPSLPSAALAELAASFLNNSNAIHEMSPVGTAMERSVIRWIAGALAFGAGADGVLTSGGSLGNLTALLAARQAKAGYDTWNAGSASSAPLALLVTEEAHYSVERAVKIMGWGEGGIVAVPTDSSFRLRPDALGDAYARATHSGRRVIAAVANAASTASGAYDPLEPMADFCQKHDLWLHVDGAHGASAALSEKYRYLVAGIERADSVVWDAHKVMLMPSLISAVIFRDGARSYEAFAQEASYLFERDNEWFNLGHRTFECTKRAISLKLYASLAVHGTRLFADYVTAAYDLARQFAALIRSTGDFELAAEPESNIVCFRYNPAGAQHGADLDTLQARARHEIIAGGSFFLVQTRLRGALWLRTTLNNPFTTMDDLAALLETIRAAAAE